MSRSFYDLYCGKKAFFYTRICLVFSTHSNRNMKEFCQNTADLLSVLFRAHIFPFKDYLF